MADVSRDLQWEGCFNVRDLGGLPLAGGGVTRRGAVVRADMLGRLTPAGRGALRDYGVQTVIDLRGEQERLDGPTGDLGLPGLRMLPAPHIPINPAVRARMDEATSMGEIYILAVDGHREATLWGLRALAAAEPGGVVIHCHSGKDRTGIAAGLLLSLAGVPDAAVAADYARSASRLRPYHARYPTGEPPWKLATPPQNMLMLLDHLRKRYGGADGYLRTAGLSESERDALRARLRPRPGETP